MPDPSTGRARARATAALLFAVAVAGCTGSPRGDGGAVTASPAASSAASQPAPSASQAAARSTAPSPSEPEPTLEPPPEATLVRGDVRHQGEVGSWTWAGGTSDAPWLPARALAEAAVTAGTVTVDVEGDVDVESWTVIAATADDTEGIELMELADGSGKPLFEVAAGDWVVAVDVRFADGRGSAIYYWHLVVT